MSNLSYIDDAALRNVGIDTTQQRDSLWNILKSSAVSAYSNLRFGLPAALEGASGSLTPEDAKYYAAWNDYRQKQAQDMAPTGAAGIDDIWSGKVGLGRGLAENVASMLPHMVGAVAGGLAGSAAGPGGTVAGAAEGAGLGGFLGMVAGGTPQFVGSNASRALQETGGLTQGQAIRSIAAAPAQAALDAVGEAFVPGFGKMLSPVANKLEGTLFRGMASKLDGNILGRTLKTAVEGAATEATTETAQQAAERWAAGDPLTTPDALREYVQAFGTAAFVGGALGGMAGPFRKHVQATPANDVTNDQLAGAADEILSPAQPEPAQTQQEPAIAAEDMVQQELPLVPPASAFPVGTQQDMLNPGTYDDLSTALAGVPTAELKKVTKSKKAPPGVAAAAAQELEARTAKNSQVATAGEQGALVPIGGDPVVASAQQLQKLLGKNQDLKKLQGLSPEDAHAGVIKLLETNDSRASTMAAADHLGIDLNARPEPVKYSNLATTLDQQQAPDEVKAALAVVPKQRGALPEDVRPLLGVKTGEELDAKIVELLGRDPTFEETAVESAINSGDRNKVQVPSRDLEAIAVHRGLLAPASGQDTAILDFTDKTRGMLRAQELTQSPVAPEEALQAAAAAQLTGEQATAFAQGAQGEPLAAPKAVSDIAGIGQLVLNPEYAAAHAAGQQWAQSKIPIATAAETRDSIANRLPQTDAQTQSSVEVAANPKLEPAQVTQQQLSDQIESLAAPQKVTTAHGTIEMVPGLARDQLDQLRKLNIGGADPSVVQAALMQAKAGEGLFAQPAAPVEVPALKGEVVTRGAPRTGRTGAKILDAERGAAQARLEQGVIPKADKVRLGVQLKRAATRADVKQVNSWLDEYGLPEVAVQADGALPETLTRASQRAETTQALKVKRVMDEVKASFNSNDIDIKTYVRLKTALEQGDVKKAIAGLPGSDFEAAGRLDSVEVTKAEQNVADAVEMELRLGNATFVQALNYALEKAPTGFEHTLVVQLKKAAAALERAGAKFDFQIVHAGDRAPPNMRWSMGLTTVNHSTAAVKVYLNGIDTGRAGVDYETLLHELSHAVTMLATRQGSLKQYQHLPFAKSVQDLSAVRDAVISHFNNRVSSGAALTEFERRAIDGRVNALDNSNEMLAWALSSREMQDYLNDIEYTPTQTLWGKLVDAVRVFLNLSAKDNSALAAVLRASEGILDGVTKVGFVPYDGTLITSAAKISAPRTVAETTATLKDVVPKLVEAAKNLGGADAKAGVSKWMLGLQTIHHITERMGRLMPSLRDYERVDQARHATHEQIAQLVVEHTQAIHKAAKVTQDRVTSLMYLTEHGADPRRKWSEQTWLHDLPNAALVKAQIAKAGTEYTELKRTGQAHLYDDAVALNEMQLYATLSVDLYNLVSTDDGYRNAIDNAHVDPTEAFRGDITARATPTSARAHWKQQLGQQLLAGQKYVDGMRGLPTIGLSANDLIRQNTHLAPIEARLLAATQALTNMQRSPYFAMLRHGDQFVAFKALGTKGAMSATVTDAIANAFGEAGFKGVYISREAAEPGIYIRFDNLEQRDRATALAKTLQTKGVLDPETRITAGPRDSSGVAQNQSSKKVWYDNMVAQMRAQLEVDADGLSEADSAKERDRFAAFETQLRQDWLNTISDSSLVKVMTQRSGRSGYNADMIRNFATRGEMTALALANQAAAPQFGKAFSDMLGAVNDARLVESPNHAHVQSMFDTMNEVQLRHQQRSQIERIVLGDKLRAVTNVFYLGMSPAYVLTQFTQLGAMLLPELGKTHGFSKSFSAIARATPQAVKLMSAVWAEGRRQGWRHWGDAAITPSVIQAAGLSAEDTAFVTNMVASGGIDIGAAVRALGWISDGKADSKTESGMRLASSFGLYSEITTRLIAALAAHDLHNPAGGVSTVDYANHVLNEAMFNYASSNTARYLGKKGVAGPITPMMTQFMQYSAQLMEKLYREFHTAIRGETVESRAVARRFLAGHAVAVTALAGTLGLPFASAAAWAVEKLVDMFDDDDEPFDATAAWRGFLASMFGQKMGEVLARGAPRALGFDLSSRVGEQDLLPFTSFLTDRNNWKEAAKTQAFQSFGAQAGMGVSVMGGVSKIADGDWLSGMLDMMPTAFKNVGKAYTMSDKGYVDARGNSLPITPGAADILYQLVGLTSSTRADYTEKAGDVAQRRISMSRQAAVLRNHIVDATIAGDRGALQDLIPRAVKFDEDSPGFAVLPGVDGAVRRKLTASATAKALSAPLGVRLSDIRGQQLVDY